MRDDHRKARLRHLIETDYGSQVAFVNATGISKTRVSQALGKSQPFAEDAALIWEGKTKLPPGWFSNNWPTPKEAKDERIPLDQPYPDKRAAAGTAALDVSLEDAMLALGRALTEADDLVRIQVASLLDTWIRHPSRSEEIGRRIIGLLREKEPQLR